MVRDLIKKKKTISNIAMELMWSPFQVIYFDVLGFSCDRWIRGKVVASGGGSFISVDLWGVHKS